MKGRLIEESELLERYAQTIKEAMNLENYDLVRWLVNNAIEKKTIEVGIVKVALHVDLNITCLKSFLRTHTLSEIREWKWVDWEFIVKNLI